MSAWITTRSGRLIDFNNIKTDDISIKDIAHHLSNICRFGGACDPFLSVAEHSLAGLWLAKEEGWSSLEQLYMLLHDAPEYILNDMISPLKRELPQYQEHEYRVQSAIFARYSLSTWNYNAIKVEIKRIDNILFNTEWERFMPKDARHNRPQELIDNFPVNYSIPYALYASGEAYLPFLQAFSTLSAQLSIEKIE